MKIESKLWNIKTICALFVLLSIFYLDLPGLYMDSVNPDYMALHMSRPENVPSWTYPDNAAVSALFHEPYRYPVLNSLYGTCLPAYIYFFISKLMGSGTVCIRILHLVYCIGILYACYQLLQTAMNHSKFAFWGTLFLALDTTMVFVSRTQYYLQLFPHLFFLPAILILLFQAEDIVQRKENKRKVFMASVLMGLGASSYFMFAGYYAFLLIMLCIVCVLSKRKMFKLVLNSIVGFLIGYFPFLYGHLSILVQSGVHGYLDTLKGLRVYGIEEGQTSIMERVIHFFKMLLEMSGGNTIIYGMTGKAIGNKWQFLFFGLFLCLFFWSAILIIKEYHRGKYRMFYSKEIMLVAMLDTIVVAHFVMALLIGTSLGYQHYVMLLPVMYMIMALMVFLLNRVFLTAGRENDFFQKNRRRVVIAGLVVTMSFSFIRIAKGYQNITGTNGMGYYSGTVNDIGNYLRNVTTEDDVIVCPQWGYWMGVAIITGGEKEIWNDTDKDELISRINSRHKEGKLYYICDNNTDPLLLDELIKETDMSLEMAIPFQDYGDILESKVLMLKRLE